MHPNSIQLPPRITVLKVPRIDLLSLGLAWLTLVTLAMAQAPSDNLPSEINAARAVLELSSTDAEKKIPCRIQGVVTCSNRRGELLFVQDASAGVYVYFSDNLPNQGDFVEVRGTSAQGLFSPIVLADKITVLRRDALPPPRPVAIEELAFGRHDSQWVQVEGVVNRQSIDWGHLVLVLASGSARLEVRILEVDTETPPNWVDARVKVRGVAGTAYNQHRQLIGFHLLTQSTNSIEIIRPPPQDPFSVPIRSSASLMAYTLGGGSEHRTRLQGVVTWSWPGRGFYLRDSRGDVHVLPSERDSPQPGNVVDAVGFAAPTFNRPVLRDAMFRKTGLTLAPEARRTSLREAADGSADGELVTLEGIVLKAGEHHRDHSALVIESDQLVFRARYQDAWPIPDPHRLVGGKIRVTGICTPDSSDHKATQEFSLWLRGADDCAILESSPVWRQRQARWALGSLGGVVFLGAVWIALLRHRVGVQTQAVRQREAALEERYLDLFENANDIIYSHDLQGIITSINNSGQEILGRTEKELVGTNIESLIEPEDLPIVRNHLASKIAGAPRTSYEVRVRASNGQSLILEVNSRLLFENGKPIGIQGIARDITDRKEAEEALRSSERQLRASLEERDRLGRDLHDGIIQSIYAAGLTLDDCTRMVRPEPENAERRLKSVTSDLNRVIRDVRQFIGRLEQDPLSGAEFKTALQSLALTSSGPNPAHVETRIDDIAAQRLLSHQATHLLQIAREAMSNSIRHGNARQIVFSLQATRGGLQFEIEDDGSGFAPSDTDRKGRGLRNIAARADRLGAWLRIQAKPGEGTKISLELPTEDTYGTSAENPSPDRR